MTELKAAHETYLAAVERFGVDRVLVPSMLGVEAQTKTEEAPHMTIDIAAAWYVVHTHPRAEAKALLNLDRQGFTCYLPRYLKRRRHARRVETVAAALFPRYLFVDLDLATQQWWPIRSTFGVADLVFNGGQPAPVSAESFKPSRGVRTSEVLSLCYASRGLRRVTPFASLTACSPRALGCLRGWPIASALPCCLIYWAVRSVWSWTRKRWLRSDCR